MKVVFIIERLPTYGAFSPIVDAALARGWEVECWHDYGQPTSGLKGYQFASLDAAPRFFNGRPVFKTYQDRSELAARLAADGTVDAVVSTEPPPAGSEPVLAQRRPIWLAVQQLLDFFVNHAPDRVLMSDVIAVHSRWWLDWAGDYCEAAGLVREAKAYVADVVARAALVGFPALDAARLIDPVEVRRRWSIPPAQPVVLLFPFPQGVGGTAFWPTKIYQEPNRLKQLAHVVAQRRFEYARDVWYGWNDVRVVQALRRFCDRNGAYLIVKSRRKTPIPAYVEAAADRCLYDESVYPPTILEALSVASLSLSHYSASVLESVALGVPHVCVPFEAEDYVGPDAARLRHFSSFFHTDEGGAFQFRGVATALHVPEFLSDFSRRPLGDFMMEPQARDRYIARFMTHAAGDGAVRTVNAIEQAVSAASPDPR